MNTQIVFFQRNFEFLLSMISIFQTMIKNTYNVKFIACVKPLLIDFKQRLISLWVKTEISTVSKAITIFIALTFNYQICFINPYNHQVEGIFYLQNR